MIIPIIILNVVLFVGSLIYSSYVARKRREAMQVLAQQLGLRFNSHRDHSIASRFNFLNKLSQGTNRYAYNVLSGNYQNNKVLIFDYHYETHSTDSKGRRRTTHYYFSFFILWLPRSFPELIISKEGFFSKVAQFFGYDDIDFESAEFSRQFVVRSPDKKFAYDFCNAQMIDYLLENPDLQLEVEHDSLGMYFNRCLSPEAIVLNLDRLTKIRKLIPDYLFSRR